MGCHVTLSTYSFYLDVKKRVGATKSGGSYGQAWLSVRHDGLVWDVEILAIPVWVWAAIFTRLDPLPGLAS